MITLTLIFVLPISICRIRYPFPSTRHLLILCSLSSPQSEINSSVSTRCFSCPSCSPVLFLPVQVLAEMQERVRTVSGRTLDSQVWVASSGAASTPTLGRQPMSSAFNATPPSLRSRLRSSLTTSSAKSPSSLETLPSPGIGGLLARIGDERDAGTGHQVSPPFLTLFGRAVSRTVDWMKIVCSSRSIWGKLTWLRMTLVIPMDTIFVK